MTKLKQIYKCEICGNIVEVLHDGVGTLVCCEQNMKLMLENADDSASKEKHIPVIEKDKEGVIIKVGSIPHPMEEKHYIEWIEISTDNGESKKFLTPGMNPESKFPIKAKAVKARAYCNIHGLWKSQ